MGELLLCRQPIAAQPFYLETVSWNIYSMEELCYYIASRTSLLDRSLMSEELCGWIDSQMGMHQLAARLRHMIEDATPLHIFCGAIMNATGYLTQDEIRHLMRRIASLENLSAPERSKIRADGLLAAGRCRQAIFSYRKILLMDPAQQVSVSFAGNVYHNMGTAYARDLMFKEAANCFEKAYQLNHNETSALAMLASYEMQDDQDMIQIQCSRYRIGSDVRKRLKSLAAAILASQAYAAAQRDLEDDLKGGREALRRRLDQIERAYVHAMADDNRQENAK